ncbi:MAG TPA: glycosyltransferase family 4 protein [Methylomirabilota bacterium]|nr:glycosyltransferase family 4 protein [Methylomirabilota bacterium]
MRICLVGGIFDRPEAVRSKQLVTPETVLLDGFRKAGVEVDAVGHARFEPSDDYDIIHVHHFGRAALKMASARGRARRVFTGHNGTIPTGWERSRLRRYLFRYVVDRADAFVALSHAEARYFADVTNADKIHTIPNGIPADVFRANGDAGKRSDEDRYDVLYVGQLIQWKGVHVLLEAMRQLRGRRHVHLRLVYHNAQLEAELRRQAVDLGIAEDVEFVGIRDPIELAREYHQADLLVLPSFADCLPSVVTESLLCGTPVVAGGVCGVPDQVGAYGLAVPPGDAVALANAMDAILADRPRWRAAAAEMRAYAERTFKPETMVARHLAMYEELRRGDRVAAKRGAFWVDLAVRLAIEGYWRRGPGHRGDRRRGGPEKATVDAH